MAYRKLKSSEIERYEPLQDRKWVTRLNKDLGYQASAIRLKLKGIQGVADYDLPILEDVYKEYLKENHLKYEPLHIVKTQKELEDEKIANFDLGKYIRMMMKRDKIKRSEMSKLAGVSDSTITNLTKNDCDLRISRKKEIMERLGISYE